MTLRTFAATCLMTAALASVARPGLADDVRQAKTHFAVGARAYEERKFRVAIDAFEESYRLAPRPAILFSIAQAYRRQYYDDRADRDLTQAIAYYRRYLDDEPKGKRVGDAKAALGDLEPIAIKLGLDQKEAPPAPAPEARPARILIAVSVKNATARVDGGAPVELPNSIDVTPGKHSVTIEAEGYVTEQREVQLDQGEPFPLEVRMTEQPAKLGLDVADGVRVYVDGRVSATTPLAGDLEVPPGPHAISFARRGYDPVSVTVELRAGERRPVKAELSPSAQRVTSYVFFAATGLVTVGGAGLMGLAFVEQSQAQEIDDKAAAGTITEEERVEHEDSLTQRDRYRAGAIAGLAGGAALGLTGVLLYVLDDPEPSAVPLSPRRDEAPTPVEKPDIDIAVGPGFVSASAGWRF